MFRKSTVALALLLLLLSFRLNALGLGEIEMLSGLNQPMSADVSLISTSGVNLSEVGVALASRDSHERLGLFRSNILSNFRFVMAEDSRGNPVIHISSTELVREPYLEFLLEMVWENGQMVREYTVLVDPPVTMQAVPVVPVAPVVTAPKPVVTVPVKQLQPIPAPQPVLQTPTYIPAPVEKKAAEHYGPIRREEALWGIAEKLRPSGEIGIQQMMIALQRVNPDAFGDENINNLKAGVTLKVPDRKTILAIDADQARAEAGQQYRDWSDKRNAAKTVAQKPAPVVPAREEATIAEIEPRLTLTPAESEMVTGAASGSEAGTPDSGEGGTGNVQQQLVLATEEVEAGRAEAEELQSRVEELENQIKKMQRLLVLKSDELAGMQNQPDSVVADEMAVIDEPQPDENAVAEMEGVSDDPSRLEVEVSSEEDSPVVEPRGIVDRLMDNPVLAGLGVLVAMLLGGFLWGSMRKQDNQKMYADEVTLDKHLQDQRASEPSSEAAVSVSDPGEFDDGSSDELEATTSNAMNDPVTEADVYLAYGRIQQAEDVLQAALKDDPDNMVVRAKLLKVYHAAGNVAAFDSAASEFRESVSADDEQWQRIALMGSELSPGNELYRATTAALGEQDNVVEFDMDLSGLDDMSAQAAVAAGIEAGVEDMNIAVEADEIDALPESLEFTLEDEDESEAEGLLASADEVATKLDLARAYLDMEDPEGARSILQEVIEEGNEEQKSEAQSLITKIA